MKGYVRKTKCLPFAKRRQRRKTVLAQTGKVMRETGMTYIPYGSASQANALQCQEKLSERKTKSIMRNVISADKLIHHQKWTWTIFPENGEKYPEN